MQVEYFRQKLLRWRADLLREADGTLASLSEGGIHEADITDRASVETDRALELRTRDRARKLISKIDQALDADRERHLRVLRGDRRADRPAPAGGAADRHPVDRGAGAPRAHGARPPRRLRRTWFHGILSFFRLLPHHPKGRPAKGRRPGDRATG